MSFFVQLRETKRLIAVCVSLLFPLAALTYAEPARAATGVGSTGCSGITVSPGVYEADFANSWSSSTSYALGGGKPGTAFLRGNIRVEITRGTSDGDLPVLKAQAVVQIAEGWGRSNDGLTTWFFDQVPFTYALNPPTEWVLGAPIPVGLDDDEGPHWDLMTYANGDCLSFRVSGSPGPLQPQPWDAPTGEVAPNAVLQSTDQTPEDLEQRRTKAQSDVDAILASVVDASSRDLAVRQLYELWKEGDPCVVTQIVVRALQFLVDSSAVQAEQIASAGPFTGEAAGKTREAAERELLVWIDADIGGLGNCLSRMRLEEALQHVLRGFIQAERLDQALTLDDAMQRAGLQSLMSEIAKKAYEIALRAFQRLQTLLGNASDAEVLAAAIEALRLDRESTLLGNPSNGVPDWIARNLCGGSVCHIPPVPSTSPPAAVKIRVSANGRLRIRVINLSLGQVERVQDYQVRVRTAKHPWQILRDGRSRKPLITPKFHLRSGNTYLVQVRALGRNADGKVTTGPWSAKETVAAPD